jgi:hypothetical protein
VQPRHRWVVTLLLIALIPRILAALAVGGGFHFADEAIYVDAARRLAAGGGFDVEYRNVPAYPVFLLLISLGVPVEVTYIRVAQSAVAALGSPLVFTLGDRLLGHRVAVVAGLVYALDPLLVVSSGLLYPETAAALLVPLLVLSVLGAAERNRLSRSALAGGLVGMLALLRPVALVLLPVVAAWMGLMRTARFARRLAHVGVLVTAFLLILAPWTVRNFRVHGHFVPVATAGAQGAPVAGNEVARRGLVESMAQWAWSDPGALISRVGRQFVQFWELSPTRLATDDPEKVAELHRRDPRLAVQPLFARGLRDLVSAVTFGAELAFAIVGLLSAARANWRRTLLPLALIVAYAAGYALFIAKLRYRIPVLPLLFVYSAAGVMATASLARWRRRQVLPNPV